MTQMIIFMICFFQLVARNSRCGEEEAVVKWLHIIWLGSDARQSIKLAAVLILEQNCICVKICSYHFLSQMQICVVLAALHFPKKLTSPKLQSTMYCHFGPFSAGFLFFIYTLKIYMKIQFSMWLRKIHTISIIYISLTVFLVTGVL